VNGSERPWHSTSHTKTFRVGRLKLTLQYNGNDGWMGRCGGGWLYKFGIMGGKSEVCIELTWLTIRVAWPRVLNLK